MGITDTIDEARRVMEICNACRYCEGFCAVFPAMEKRRLFTQGDLDYLANLCHGCQGCFHACQYAPPHAFGVNVPVALAEHRADTYSRFAWPRPLQALFQRNGLKVSLIASLSLTAIILLSLVLVPGTTLFGAHRGPGSFYAVVPYAAMVGIASALGLFVALALFMGVRRFYRATQNPLRQRVTGQTLLRALGNAATLRYLGGGGDGCNDRDDTPSHRRRLFHQCTMYGFLLCFAATCVATVYAHGFGWPAPYAYTSLPVLLGDAGGIALLAGTGGLFWVRLASPSAPRAQRLAGMDVALLLQLFFTALTGLLLMAFRSTPAMGVLLAIHLGFVLGLFLTLPYGKFVHGAYRLAALVQFHGES